MMAALRRYIWILSAIALAGCAAAAVAAERAGPQVSRRESVDWSRLKAIDTVELNNLLYSDPDSLFLPTSSQTMELKFFPQQQLITFAAIPAFNGGLQCTERGQTFDLMFIASPGADVADRMDCSGQGIQHYQLSMSYHTTSRFTANTLAIEGSARIHRDGEDGIEDYVVDLHGVIQISGGTCRVTEWRQAYPSVSKSPGGTSLDHNASLVLKDTSTCRVIKSESK